MTEYKVGDLVEFTGRTGRRLKPGQIGLITRILTYDEGYGDACMIKTADDNEELMCFYVELVKL